MKRMNSLPVPKWTQKVNRAEISESAEKQQERRFTFYLISAPSAPLRAPVPSGRVLVVARRAKPGNVALGTRFFEQEKTERTEHEWTLSISPLPLLPPVQIMRCGLPAAPLRDAFRSRPRKRWPGLSWAEKSDWIGVDRSQ
jgi:hypothetical protein